MARVMDRAIEKIHNPNINIINAASTLYLFFNPTFFIKTLQKFFLHFGAATIILLVL